MITQTPPDRLVIAIQTRHELDDALNGALDILTPVAASRRVGIMVTRLAPGRYEARLNDEIPPGTTKESWGSSPTKRANGG